MRNAFGLDTIRLNDEHSKGLSHIYDNEGEERDMDHNFSAGSLSSRLTNVNGPADSFNAEMNHIFSVNNN